MGLWFCILCHPVSDRSRKGLKLCLSETWYCYLSGAGRVIPVIGYCGLLSQMPVRMLGWGLGTDGWEEVKFLSTDTIGKELQQGEWGDKKACHQHLRVQLADWCRWVPRKANDEGEAGDTGPWHSSQHMSHCVVLMLKIVQALFFCVKIGKFLNYLTLTVPIY